MFNWIIRIVFYTSLLCVKDTEAQNASSVYLTEPQNTAVVTGDMAVFNCSYYTNRSGEILYWRLYEGADDTTGRHLISVEPTYDPTILDDDYIALDYTNMGIPNATSDYALGSDGDYILYACWLVQEDGIQKQAHLIVLESQTTCGDDTTQGQGHVHVTPQPNQTTVTLSCSVSYVGFYGPSLAWHGEDGSLIHDVCNETDAGQVTSSLTVADLDTLTSGTPFVCRTYFADPPEIVDADPNDKRTYDQSAPQYQSDCTVYLGRAVTTADAESTQVTKPTTGYQTTGDPDFASSFATDAKSASLFSLTAPSTRGHAETSERTSTTTVQLTGAETTNLIECTAQTTPERHTKGQTSTARQTTEEATTSIRWTLDSTINLDTTAETKESGLTFAEGSVTSTALEYWTKTLGSSPRNSLSDIYLSLEGDTSPDVTLPTSHGESLRMTATVTSPTEVASSRHVTPTEPALLDKTSDDTTVQTPQTTQHVTTQHATTPKQSTAPPTGRGRTETSQRPTSCPTTEQSLVALTQVTNRSWPRETELRSTDNTGATTDWPSDNETTALPGGSDDSSSGMPWWALLILLLLLLVIILVILAVLVYKKKYRPLMIFTDQRQLMTSAFSEENIYQEVNSELKGVEVHDRTAPSSLDGTEEEGRKLTDLEASPDDITIGMDIGQEGQTVRRTVDKQPALSEKPKPSMFWSSIIYIENWIKPKINRKKKSTADVSQNKNSEKIACKSNAAEVFKLDDVSTVNIKADSKDQAHTVTDPEISCWSPDEGDDNQTQKEACSEKDSNNVLRENEEFDLHQDFTVDL